jgi:hypothetical protein
MDIVMWMIRNTLGSCIQEVSHLNLGWGIIMTGFMWLSSVSPGQRWNSTSNEAIVASFHILSNSLKVYQSTI